MLNVLISLYSGYGLGDGVLMSAVLKHLRKYRPNWSIDYRADSGRHEVGHGIVENTFPYGHPFPRDHYDAEVEILLYDTWANWHDRPNTRVSSCLHERFGLAWDIECGRYEVNVPEKIEEVVEWRWSTFMPMLAARDKPIVGVHYKGDSAVHNKDLSDSQADIICDHILSLGAVPLILDWRNVSPVAARSDVGTTGRSEWSREWGRSAQYNCAVIQKCKAFIGIDSGPGKCASATSTPSLIIWTGHHPAAYHDPAPNTSHLVPRDFHNMHPINGQKGVIDWFDAHYKTWQYNIDPTKQVKKWLEEVLCR